MSSPLLPTSGPTGSAASTSAATLPEDDPASFVAELGARRPLTIGARTAGPPSDLLEQIADAGRLHQQLRERGEELRFSRPAAGARVSIVLHDSAAITGRSVSLSEAFAIVAGEPAE